MRRTGILLLSLALLLASGAMVSGTASATVDFVSTGAIGGAPSVSGSIIAFVTLESHIGQDLNGDGELRHQVMRYYDISTGEVTNTGVEGHGPISGSVIAVQTPEGGNYYGIGEDLNGDGDTSDIVIRYYDISTGTVTNTGAVGGRLAVSGNIIAFQTYEHDIGQDANGDGDTLDPVIRYYDISTGEVANTGAIGAWPSISGSVIAFRTEESKVGQDLDGDGDTNGYVIRYYDISTGSVINTGAEGLVPSVSGSVIAFETYEGWWGIDEDLNGDGDIEDYVIRYYDISTDTLTNTGADGSWPDISGSVIAFETIEWRVDEDLNGDRDTMDGVIRYYDISTGAVRNTGADGGGVSVSGDIVALHTSERSIDEDLNGDGDTIDDVIRYFNLPEAPTLPTIEAISGQIDAFLADGSIDNEGIAEALHAFLEQAEAMIETGNIVAAENILNAFINSVEAQSQSGRLVTTEAAQALIDGAQWVIGGLR